jgi:hypothetical protein
VHIKTTKKGDNMISTDLPEGEPIPFAGWVQEDQLSRLMAQAKLLAQLAKQVEDYSELVYEATKLELRIKEYEQRR